ncbi:MAG: hypothetical protein WD534_17565 [Phycisphaeraceae bacterium]
MKTRSAFAVLVALLIATSAYAALQNRAAQRAQEKYDAAIERAESEYAQAIERATETYTRELNQALQGAMRAGAVEEVEEIRTELERAEAGAERGRQTAADLIVGVWHDASGRVEFASDGRVVRSYVPGVGSWRVADDGLIEVAFERGDTPRWKVAVLDDSDRALCVRFRPGNEVGVGVIHTRQ